MVEMWVGWGNPRCFGRGCETYTSIKILGCGERSIKVVGMGERLGFSGVT